MAPIYSHAVWIRPLTRKSTVYFSDGFLLYHLLKLLQFLIVGSSLSYQGRLMLKKHTESFIVRCAHVNSCTHKTMNIFKFDVEELRNIF